MIVLEILLLVVLHIAVLVGLAGIVLGIGGNFILLLLATLVAWIGGFALLAWPWLLGLLGLALLGEAVEALLGVLTARQYGATRWGMLGTLLGGLAGAAAGTAVLPVVGSLLGAFAGAFVGAFLGEWLAGRKPGESARAGWGAFVGRVAATAFKLMIGVLIAFITLRSAYPLVGD